MAHVLGGLSLAPQYAVKYGAKYCGHAQGAGVVAQPGEVQRHLHAKIGSNVICMQDKAAELSERVCKILLGYTHPTVAGQRSA